MIREKMFHQLLLCRLALWASGCLAASKSDDANERWYFDVHHRLRRSYAHFGRLPIVEHIPAILLYGVGERGAYLSLWWERGVPIPIAGEEITHRQIIQCFIYFLRKRKFFDKFLVFDRSTGVRVWIGVIRNIPESR